MTPILWIPGRIDNLSCTWTLLQPHTPILRKAEKKWANNKPRNYASNKFEKNRNPSIDLPMVSSTYVTIAKLFISYWKTGKERNLECQVTEWCSNNNVSCKYFFNYSNRLWCPIGDIDGKAHSPLKWLTCFSNYEFQPSEPVEQSTAKSVYWRKNDRQTL